MKIIFIENTCEYDRLLHLAKTNKFLLFPLFNDDSHPIKSEPIVVFAKPLDLNELFVIGISHSELINLPFPFEQFDAPFIYNKKYWSLPNSTDVETLYYAQNLEYTIDLFKSQEDWRTYPIYKIVDGLLPALTDFSETCKKSVMGKDIKFINDITIPTLAQIESYGIKVDSTFEPQSLVKDGFVYSQYNHLTTTGRPSNRYGGVNFSALNKSDGSRNPFVSRFDDGMLFMLDYDSYHIRLIAKLIDYALPQESVHAYFAKQYFNTDTITEEQYEKSKQISFQMMYGGILPEYEHITFFRSIQFLIDELWDAHQQTGYVPSVISGIKINADSRTKLFNYVIQNYETEQNMLVLRKILLETSKFESVPILYTYDSVLFDVKESETETYLNKVRQIMELNGQFPVKTSYGKNYGEMIKL